MEDLYKVLYVVNTVEVNNNKCVHFYAVQVKNETDNEFIIIDKINIENYTYSFPKIKTANIGQIVTVGRIKGKILKGDKVYRTVSDKLNKEILRTQIDRIYKKLKRLHPNQDIIAEKYYIDSIDFLKKCIIPEEYEARKLIEKEKNNLLNKQRKYNLTINPDEANKVIETLTTQYDSKELGIFISLLSYEYIQKVGITKEQFMTSLSNSIDKLEDDE